MHECIYKHKNVRDLKAYAKYFEKKQEIKPS